ncbi:hypothetical protein ABGB17_00390 [Sphaerisporangium sp. B11E5]|uniref:hypothetical protein n=1 Tax=Sphaerisporangium sp. B11E5 TaxID=3153563 RepID=UPI00325EFF04
MSDAQSPMDTAVFVDQSGRRARVLMVVGVLSGTLLMACMAVLIAGVFTGTPLTVTGWPGGDPKPPAPAATSSSPTADRPRKPSARPVTARHTPSATVTPTPTRKPTATRTPRATPSSTASPSTSPPADEPTGTSPTPDGTEPPGRTKQPPGHDPERTQGPKK